MHTVTKIYRDLPAAHRSPKHDGHCRLIHGHNFGFDITFAANELDKNGFVVDVGQLKLVREFLKDTFDHTLLLNADDLYVEELKSKLYDFAKIVTVPNCGMEGLAKYIYHEVNKIAKAIAEKRGLRVIRVVCFEDSKNSAAYVE